MVNAESPPSGATTTKAPQADSTHSGDEWAHLDADDDVYDAKCTICRDDHEAAFRKGTKLFSTKISSSPIVCGQARTNQKVMDFLSAACFTGAENSKI